MLRFNLKNQEEVKAIKILQEAGCIQTIIAKGVEHVYLDDKITEEFASLIEDLKGEEILVEPTDNSTFINHMVKTYDTKTVEVFFNKVKLEHPKMMKDLEERINFINRK